MVNEREEWQYLLHTVWLSGLASHQHDSSVSCRSWNIKLIGFLLDPSEEALIVPYHNSPFGPGILVDSVVLGPVRENVRYP